MKARPDTNTFGLKKDPSDFLNRPISDGPTQLPIPTLSKKMPREQKVFRLPIDVIALLKKEAYERSVKTGDRVTETDLVEQALRSYLAI